MIRLRLRVGLLHRSSELAERLCACVAGKVAEVPEVRADRDIEDYVVRVLDSEHAALRGHASALRDALNDALELQHTLALGLVAVDDRVVPFGNDGPVLPRRQDAGLEGDRALLGRRDSPYYYVVGEARERLADVLHPAARELHARNRRVERKSALVLLRLRFVAEVDLELAEVLVRARAVVVLWQDFLLRLVVAVENRLPDLGERVGTYALGNVLAGAAGPDGVLVDRDQFLRVPAVDHAAEPSVADRIRLGPHLRRTVREQLHPLPRRLEGRRRQRTVPLALDEDAVLVSASGVRDRNVHRLVGRDGRVEELRVAALYDDSQPVLDEVDDPPLALARHLVVEEPRRLDACGADRREEREPARELRRAHLLALVARLGDAGPKRLHGRLHAPCRRLDRLGREHGRIYGGVEELALQPVAAARVDAERNRQFRINGQPARERRQRSRSNDCRKYDRRQGNQRISHCVLP